MVSNVRATTALGALLVTAGLGPRFGRAEPPAPSTATRPDDAGAAAGSLDNAPRPTEASGVLIPREDEDEAWRWVPRVVLFVPRWAFEVAMAPPRLVAWAYDRYQIKDRLQQIFFNDTGDVGLYPVALFETGFGLNAGARFINRNLLGKGEHLRVRASYGGRFRQLYSLKATSGERLGGAVQLELEAAYEQFPKSRFFGFGNGDLIEPTDGMALIDPRGDDTAIATRYRHDDTRVELALFGQLPHNLKLRASTAWKRRAFDPDAELRGDADVREVYDTAALLGYDFGLSNLYTEVSATYDSRRGNRFYLSPAAPSTGWNLTAFYGYQIGYGDDPSSHGRWGLDLQRYIDLYAGDRVLMLRAYMEAVTVPLEEVPFLDLPHLGGPLLLRGYDRERFRDRYVGMVTAEYQYPVERNFGGYLFVDAGRAWRDMDDVGFDDWRLGFGGGLQIHTVNSFLARAFLASSTDGGLIFNLSFDPIFDARSREEKP